MVVAVLVLDPPVLAVDHKLRLLVLRNLPSPINRGLLTVEQLSVTFGAGTPDRPLVAARDDMLVALAHFQPFLQRNAAKYRCGRESKRGQFHNVRVAPINRTYKKKEEPVPPSSLPERHASPEEVAAAVVNLRPEELRRLRKRAELQIWGTEYTDPMELLGEAVKRAMIATDPNKCEDERGRPWPMDRVELPAFLSKSIDSIADDSRQSLHQIATQRLEALAGEDRDIGAVLHGVGHYHTDVIEQAIELEDIQARQAAAKLDADAIERHFAGDQAVLAIIEGEKEEMSAREVQALFELDETTYDSARRRLRRKVDRLMPGRRLK